MRKFMLSLLLLGIGANGFSQDDKSTKPALIIATAGWSYADLNQGSETTDQRNGFFAGVRKDIRIFPTIHLETGALFVQKGATLEIGESERIEYKLNYIDIPAALKFKFGGLYGLAGVSGNIRVNSEIEGEKVEDIKPFELSSSVGFGYKLFMISIDFRWNHSLGNILKDNPGDDVYNSYFLVGLGFNFHKNKN